MMKRLLTILCIPAALLLLSSTEGWSLSPCEGSNILQWTNCFGSATYPDGSKYVGEWKDGKRNGHGTGTHGPKSKFAGDIYIGEYRDGKILQIGIRQDYEKSFLGYERRAEANSGHFCFYNGFEAS